MKRKKERYICVAYDRHLQYKQNTNTVQANIQLLHFIKVLKSISQPSSCRPNGYSRSYYFLMRWLLSETHMIDGIGQVGVTFLRDWDINHTMHTPSPRATLPQINVSRDSCLMLLLLWEVALLIIFRNSLGQCTKWTAKWMTLFNYAR